MRIAIGNDHAAVVAKRRVCTRLAEGAHQVVDVGTGSADSTDYPDYAADVARRVAAGEVERGILLCGTGIGMCIAANKIAGVRAALAHSEETARLAREHNDANVLCLGARVLDETTMLRCVDVFLTTPFAGGRHAARVAKMTALETGR